MLMTPDARHALSTTVRSLRARLLGDLHDATETAYRPAVRTRDAGLKEIARTRRARLEAWISEQLRAQGASEVNTKHSRTAEDFRFEAEKQAAYTFLNRLVILRLMEAPGPSGESMRAPAVVTGGWESRAYKDFRQIAPALVQGDETEGYAFLLQLVFEDLATELPGLYGPLGVADLIPIPPATLRHIVEKLDDPELETCWTDDMTLGWVYQYWNDPERKAIDEKLNTGGQVEPYEIASKTQLFTERYMVDWLLQNSLGPMWLAMCKKHGWTAEVKTDGTLQRLEERRVEWRAKRDAGEASLTELMPLHTAAERRWAYYVPQPIPDDAVVQASESVRDLKILDPAVGSGHFLVVAMELLLALYLEEARHRGLSAQPEWTDRAIVERMLSHNLHGIDLDPRAVQIAAAAVWLKASRLAPEARPERLNLVASNLRLASLPDDDPVIAELRLEVERETGIPGGLTDTIVHALRGADHLGTLLRVDRAVDQAIEAHELTVGPRFDPQQVGMFGVPLPRQGAIAFEAVAARRTLLEHIEAFLSHHTSGDDLGLRLHGEQLAAGVRFVRMVREGTYDLVIGNPPYLASFNLADRREYTVAYPEGRHDLFAGFVLRGFELARLGGELSLITMQGWMFAKQFSDLRRNILDNQSIRTIALLGPRAFSEIEGTVVSAALLSARKGRPSLAADIATLDPDALAGAQDGVRCLRIHAALLSAQAAPLGYDDINSVEHAPLLLRWSKDRYSWYREFPTVGSAVRAGAGISTGNNDRFLRFHWETQRRAIALTKTDDPLQPINADFVPFIKGSAGIEWIEPLREVICWRRLGLEKRVVSDFLGNRGGGNGTPSSWAYFLPGVAISTQGDSFSARVHRFRSVISNKGSSLYPSSPAALLTLLNSAAARQAMSELNPGFGFELGDVRRLPLFSVEGYGQIVSVLSDMFEEHESHREPSVEFRNVGPSAWRSAQEWAQRAVDRPESTPLPLYDARREPEPPTDHVSFALGVALGRLGPNDEGILDPTRDDLSRALPAGILFLDNTLEDGDNRDGLGHPSAALLHSAWAKHRQAVSLNRKSLREWLALDFFKDVHRGMYENRPIHWPLSSANKTFVAWVNIHRFTEKTLRVLLADYLYDPALKRIEGELSDLRAARDGADRKAARAAEKQYDRLLKAKEELQTFITDVEQCADRGAPPTDAKCPPREQDARYDPFLDDGVMINSAALWPLLEPQWKDPKKWWRQLSEAKGKKDYDWSHLAMRYWPTRVDQKCQRDPSLGVAHGCFWRYHSERAWAWELRLQDEIASDFRIDEVPYLPGGRDLGDEGSGSHRVTWLRNQPHEALAAVEREAVRRMGRRKSRRLLTEMQILDVGLWSLLPDEVWDMELRLSEKQGAEFRLLTPDEPATRVAYEIAHADRVQWRRELIAGLVPPENWFGETEDEDAEVSDDDTIQDADEDAEAES